MTETLPKTLTILAGLTPGEVADQAARERIFERYVRQLAPSTRRRQQADLNLLARYLLTAGVSTSGPALAGQPEAWAGVTWGLLEAWLEWMLAQGYAVGSLNVRLSTAKTHARLAFKAGAIPAEQYALIRAVQGLNRKAGRHVDKTRPVTRLGWKKQTAVSLSREQADRLKAQPVATAQGRRDGLLMCLLLEHGLRCGEVAGLQVSDFDLPAGELRFYRPKVDKVQTHRLTPATLAAARAYFDAGDALALGPLLRSSRKDGRLHQAGLSTQAISARVAQLGRAMDIAGLSPHDLRHYWASQAARSGTDALALQEAGGWSSLAMPRRYVEEAKIANQGVKLG